MPLLSRRRLRTAWLRVRPLPQPRYGPDTPSIAGLMPNPMTLSEAATSPAAVAFAIEVLGRLAPSAETEAQQARYRTAQAQFGEFLRHADLLTVLWGAATLIQPQSYLEIGVRRGRSAAMVGALCPDCAIYGFDFWREEYFADPNLGPDFVRGELRGAGHRGAVELVSGDSKQTVPGFLREHPDLYFDLVTIDGDKSLVGMASDFANTLPRLKVGGIVITDDLPYAPILQRLWQKVIQRDSRYLDWRFFGAGGVAAAIRISDSPWVTSLRNLVGD